MRAAAGLLAEGGRGAVAAWAANRAVALKVVLPESGESLTPGERALLSEWLDRLGEPYRQAP